jgi:hypothetical protein
MIANRENKNPVGLKRKKHLVADHGCLVDDDKLVLAIERHAGLPSQKLFCLVVNDRPEEKSMGCRTERRTAVLGEGIIEEMTPPSSQRLPVRWPLKPRDPHAASHEFVRQTAGSLASWSHVSGGHWKMLGELTQNRALPGSANTAKGQEALTWIR